MKVITETPPQPDPVPPSLEDGTLATSNGAASRAMSSLELDRPEILIRPQRGWVGINWSELVHGRELLYFLALRDIKVRYKQTVLGIAWAVLQPLTTMLIFTVIFGRFAGIPSENMPYAVYVFAGLIPWTFFANGVTSASQTLLVHQAMLTKIYFPRLFLPTASLGPFVIDSLISFVLYGLVLLFYAVVPSWQIVFLPGLFLLDVLITLGFGYLLAALIVRYRDFRHVVPFMIQILMFASPVIYPVRMLPERYRWILALNPMSGLISGFRSSILGTPWDFIGLGISAAIGVTLFLVGLFFFRRTERLFADIA